MVKKRSGIPIVDLQLSSMYFGTEMAAISQKLQGDFHQIYNFLHVGTKMNWLDFEVIDHGYDQTKYGEKRSGILIVDLQLQLQFHVFWY